MLSVLPTRIPRQSKGRLERSVSLESLCVAFATDRCAFSVAGVGFGSGSSREDAVRALLGAGVEAVIAKSFAFICEFCYHRINLRRVRTDLPQDERNQLNMGLFSAVVVDDEFYALAQEGRTVTVDRGNKTITLADCATTFSYEHSLVEETILDAGGIVPLYQEYGRELFRHLAHSAGTHLPEAPSPVTTVNPFDLNKKAQELDW